MLKNFCNNGQLSLLTMLNGSNNGNWLPPMFPELFLQISKFSVKTDAHFDVNFPIKIRA